MSESPSFPGVIGRTAAESTPYWAAPPAPGGGAPNIVYVLLDDVGFAQARAVTLHRRGRATRIIEQDLRRAGLPVAAIEGACRALVELAPEPDLTAAIALARKKRLGPFARGPLDDGARRRQLALLARAGFSFAVARRIVDCRDAQLLEE